jgi:bis(5'-nucleosidyl)-tetraphosphatase
MNKPRNSAGIAIVRNSDGVDRLLGLRLYSLFDLPKGHIEPGESEFEAARRETQEEAGITDVKFPWGHVSTIVQKPGKSRRQVTIFVGTSEQEPVLRQNPETGRHEHHGHKWLSLDEAEQQLFPYLRSIVPWLRDVIVRR